MTSIDVEDGGREVKAMATAAVEYVEGLDDASRADVVIATMNFTTGWEWHQIGRNARELLGDSNAHIPLSARKAIREGYEARAKWAMEKN